MKIVRPTLLGAYEGRIVNIHPAYLPELQELMALRMLELASLSGVTVHWVDSGR